MLVKFEQNRMVQTIQNFDLFDQKKKKKENLFDKKKKKELTIFDKALMPFWKTFLWLTQLFDTKLLM